MIKNIIFTLIALMAVINHAFAHSSIDKSTPQDGSMLSAVPDAITMSFAKPVRITKADMVHDDKQKTKFDISSGGFVNKIKFTPPFQGNGHYVVNWRGLSEDGHVVKGSFSFKVNTE